MIRSSQWHRLPSAPVLAALPQMKWSTADGAKPAGETAALMLLVALNFMATAWLDEQGRYVAIAEGTYVDLREATGLSRALISAGLQRLVALGLIAPEGSHQKRRYKINWPEEHRFFKLPCHAIVAGNVIKPFAHFTMRSKHELHAMKLYLYFAAIRSNHNYFSMASYETIFERTGISERDIRKAISLLIGTGLLVGINRDHNHILTKNEPNKYYLTGYPALVQQKSGTLDGAVAATAVLPVAAAT
ncbi:helix-turn-helix domain-containing protein [Burkholderia pyrrocinia]|uniref:helix-turn-helix domain-containing protein n=1 Tax=Burkholderia pyrrocinia TaxID=60550 RepID=UPI001BCEAD53|nr:helix-turn-helix domain-containing protein [Burkholderia pyrrocinia]QVN17101.1 helix-turn-helix domain-containing protein [Burkholderia pyrrocinia]